MLSIIRMYACIHQHTHEYILCFARSRIRVVVWQQSKQSKISFHLHSHEHTKPTLAHSFCHVPFLYIIRTTSVHIFLTKLHFAYTDAWILIICTMHHWHRHTHTFLYFLINKPFAMSCTLYIIYTQSVCAMHSCAPGNMCRIPTETQSDECQQHFRKRGDGGRAST